MRENKTLSEDEHVENIFRLAKVRYAVMTNIPYVEDCGLQEVRHPELEHV